MRNDNIEESKSGILYKLLNFFVSKNGNEKEIKESSENIKIIDTEETNYWVSNDKVKKCHYCEKEFNSIFSKKHHCRICGNVFCYDCCQKNIKEYKGKNKI